MSRNFYHYGKCKYCDNNTHNKCDACEAFICIEHRIYVTVPHSLTKRLLLCQECKDNRKKITHSVRINQNPLNN
jgi:hypothetical protein